jgi:hypothetical protein
MTHDEHGPDQHEADGHDHGAAHDEELPEMPVLADLPALTRASADARSVRRVFGEAYERDGVLVIPVAKTVGLHGLARAVGGGRYGFGFGRPGHGPGAGGEDAPADPGAERAAPAEEAAGQPWHGHGPHGHHGQHGHPHGRGRGRGWADAGKSASRTKPLGVYVVDRTGVRWHPALDLNRVILGGQVVGAITMIALASVLRRRRRG